MTIDLKKALTNPTSVFREPHEVLEHHELTLDQKKQILSQWESDARVLLVAEDENMSGDRAAKLHRILEALKSLN